MIDVSKKQTNIYILVIVFIIFSIPLAVIVVGAVQGLNDQITFTKLERDGVKYHSALINVIRETQELRAEELIANIENKSLLNSLETMDMVNKKLGVKLKSTDTWKNIRADYDELLSQSRVISFNEYTKLIDEAMLLAQDIGDSSNLITDPELDSYYLMNISLNIIPQMTETIKKSQQEISQTLKKQADGKLLNNFNPKDYLQLIYYKIELDRDNFKQSLKRAQQSNSSIKVELAPYKDSIEQAELSLYEIYSIIADKREINLSYDSLFEAMLNTTLKYKDFDSVATPILDSLLEDRIEGIEVKKYFIFISAIITFGGLGIVFLLIYRSMLIAKSAEAQVKNLAEFPEHNPSPTLKFDTNGAVLYANPAAINMLDESQFNEIFNFIRSELKKNHELNKKTVESEISFNGKVYLIIAVKLEYNEETTFNTYFIDVTARRMYENDLKRAIQVAENANKIKSDFLANMSHELRTPLNSILGMTKILIDDLDNKSDEQETAEIIYTSASYLLDIINDILDLSKVEAGEVTLEEIGFDFKNTLASVVESLTSITNAKNITLDYKYNQNNPPYIIGDPTRLGRILTNLIGNAIKYTIEGGVDIVIDFNEIDDKTIELLCTVTDTGIGISESKLEIIFDKFSQADETTTRKFGGTGLGLAITKELVELMDGEIGVESEENKGSVFWFSIPFETTDTLYDELQGNKLLVSEDKQEIFDKIKVKDAKVLIAEDYKLNQIFIAKLLKRMGFKHYDLVDDGELAIEAYKNNSYDIILMDYHMPNVNGHQATINIRKLELGTEKHIPIVALTADAMVDTKDKCIKAGMDDYISKPIDADIFRTLLSHWFDFSDDFNAKEEEKENSNIEDVLDTSAIKLYVDTDEEIKELLNAFFKQTEETLQELKAQSIIETSETWNDIAHKLKGSSGMVGAIYFSKLCYEAEMMENHTQEEREEKFKIIELAYKEVTNIFKKKFNL